MKNILVTGDRGYIGSVLVPLLLDLSYKVTGLDAEYFVNGTKSLLHSNYKKITKDIRSVDKKDLENVEAIIHLSALSNDPMGDIDPALTEEINYKASIRLAKMAKEAGIKRFLFSSSCSIYGIAKKGIVDENSDVNPLTAYAKSKIETEKELRKIADDEKITVEQKDLDEVIKDIKDEKQKQQLLENPYLLASIIRQQKTLDFLTKL